MKKVPYFNSSQHMAHVGNVAIAPGDTRDVDASMLPDAKAPKPVAAPQSNPLLDILDQNVAGVKAALSGLSSDELMTLAEAEQNGKTRNGVMKAITDEQLSRADDQNALEFETPHVEQTESSETTENNEPDAD